VFVSSKYVSLCSYITFIEQCFSTFLVQWHRWSKNISRHTDVSLYWGTLTCQIWSKKIYFWVTHTYSYCTEKLRGLLKTHGVNFINILQAAFAHANPKSVKKDWQLDCLLCFWDPLEKKLHVPRTLIKLTPDLAGLICLCCSFPDNVYLILKIHSKVWMTSQIVVKNKEWLIFFIKFRISIYIFFNCTVIIRKDITKHFNWLCSFLTHL